MYFQPARNVELSVVDYLRTQIDANWSNVNTIKSFTQAYKTALPVVCVRLREFPPTRLEVGSNTLLYDYNIVIDIFANSEGQKNDLAYFIMDKMKDGCVYYEFSQTSGAPETLTKVANGRLHVKDYLSNTALDFGEDADKYDQHRFYVSVNMRRD
jgi:hypothetical protein